MKQQLDIIQSGQNLTEAEMIAAMTEIMEGKTNPEDTKAFLLGLKDKGESIEEITGAVRVLREKSSGLKAPYGAVDCCGTGGDSSGTYNISTAVALVTASCGVPMAKHGNRAASSLSGAADVLETLGVNLNAPQDTLEQALKELNFAFLMAPNHHQAMIHVRQARKEIGERTMFNLLGPLANPAGTKFQLIGVYDRQWLTPLAEVLKNLGTKKAWLVHGADGLDEITITGPTHVVKLNEDGIITEETLRPEDFGLQTGKPEDLKGGDAENNAVALRAVLEGKKGAYRDIVLANTSAVLNIHGTAETLKDGAQKAAKAIDSGAAMQTLKDYITLTRENS